MAKYVTPKTCELKVCIRGRYRYDSAGGQHRAGIGRRICAGRCGDPHAPSWLGTERVQLGHGKGLGPTAAYQREHFDAVLSVARKLPTLKVSYQSRTRPKAVRPLAPAHPASMRSPVSKIPKIERNLF